MIPLERKKKITKIFRWKSMIAPSRIDRPQRPASLFIITQRPRFLIVTERAESRHHRHHHRRPIGIDSGFIHQPMASLFLHLPRLDEASK